MDLVEILLPTGLAVRFEVVNTKALSGAEDAAVEFLNAKIEETATALYQHRLEKRKTRELIARQVREYARAELKYVVGKDPDGNEVQTDVPDVDATFAGIPESAWKSVTYADLLLDPGSDHNIDRLLSNPTDWQILCRRLDESTRPGKSIQVFTGKARRLSR